MYEKDYQIMPDLTDEEYDRLKADIEENGLKCPVDVDEEGNVLDGHHRVMICEELGIEYETREIKDLTEEEKFEHVVRMNVLRRQLAGEQLKELILRIKDEYPDASDRKIASMINVSHNTVASAGDEWATGQNDQLPSDDDEIPQPVIKKTTGIDDKSRPANREEAETQREMVRGEIEKHPEKSDREIAKETGVSHHTVGTQRKKIEEEKSTKKDNEETGNNKESEIGDLADELYSTLCSAAGSVDNALRVILGDFAGDKRREEMLVSEEGLEAARNGLVKIRDVIRKYERLCDDRENHEGDAWATFQYIMQQYHKKQEDKR